MSDLRDASTQRPVPPGPWAALADIERAERELAHRVGQYLAGASDKFPPYMPELLRRGALKLHAHWPSAAAIKVEYLLEGQLLTFMARLDWADAFDSMRVVILYERTGERVCESLPWRPFDIDPRSIKVQYQGDDEGDEQALLNLRKRSGRR